MKSGLFYYLKIFINMKLVIEENQFKRIIAKIAEGKYGRSLLTTRKAGISAIFPKSAIMSNPLRFRPYERQKLGIEEADLNYETITDNSDAQL